MLALEVAQYRGSICRQDLVSPLPCLLSWLSSRLASISTTCSFDSQKRAEATHDHAFSQIQVSPQKARFGFPKVSAIAFLFFSLTLIGSCDHTQKCKDQEQGTVETQRATTIGIGVNECQTAAFTETTTSIYSAFPFWGSTESCALSYFS